MNLILALITMLLMVSGQVLWKIGLSSISFSLSDFSSYVSLLKSHSIIGGTLLYIGSTFLWFQVLSNASLSKVYPLMAFSYIIGMIAGIFIFNEKVSFVNWLGAFLIICGITLVSSK